MREKLKWVVGGRTSVKVYITRVFNYGTWREWKMMKKDFSHKEIMDALEAPLAGQWTARGKAFAEVVYECKLSKKVIISYDQ